MISLANARLKIDLNRDETNPNPPDGCDRALLISYYLDADHPGNQSGQCVDPTNAPLPNSCIVLDTTDPLLAACYGYAVFCNEL